MIIPRVLLLSKNKNREVKKFKPSPSTPLVWKKFPAIGIPSFLDQTVTESEDVTGSSGNEDALIWKRFPAIGIPSFLPQSVTFDGDKDLPPKNIIIEESDTSVSSFYRSNSDAIERKLSHSKTNKPVSRYDERVNTVCLIDMPKNENIDDIAVALEDCGRVLEMNKHNEYALKCDGYVTFACKEAMDVALQMGSVTLLSGASVKIVNGFRLVSFRSSILFVHNLPTHITHTYVRDHFEQFGQLKDHFVFEGIARLEYVKEKFAGKAFHSKEYFLGVIPDVRRQTDEEMKPSFRLAFERHTNVRSGRRMF